MSDTIRWDAELPEGHASEDRIFYTKSLSPGFARYCVTAEGRLLLTGKGWEDEVPDDANTGKAIDVDFHGDVLMVSFQGQREYLVRFTHGTVEEVRPIADGEPWDSVAIASMKLYAASADQEQNGQPPLSEDRL